MRVHEKKAAARFWRAALFYARGVTPRQRFEEGLAVRERRRGGDPARARATLFDEPLEPPEDVPGVRPENAPVNVGLVNHDGGQFRKEGLPVFREAQKGKVEHVRIRQQQRRRGFLEPLPFRRRRVPVVDCRPEVVKTQPLGQFVDLSALVLRQGFVRVDE